MPKPRPLAGAPPQFALTGSLAIAGHLVDGAVIIEGGRIAEIRRGANPGRLPKDVFEAAIVAPGLVDLQVNGGFGKEIGADPDAISSLARNLPATGVTTFLPTLISSPAPVYAALFEAFAAVPAWSGARPHGLHLEGPFLSPARHGAHPLSAIADADDILFGSMLETSAVSLVTLAADREGALDRIRRLVAAGKVVSLGHTDASYEEMVTGADAGATMATHLFNAMSPFGHRQPGAVGAVLTDDRVTAGLIADGVHCHPAAVDLAIRAKGLDRIALVSDMVSACGMGPGTYSLCGRSTTVDATSVRLADGTLAGSILTMDQAVRNLVEWGLLAPAQAIRLASEVPARVLSLPEVGSITVGNVADLTLFDAQLSIERTFIDGHLVYQR